jgi:hypothetical protein
MVIAALNQVVRGAGATWTATIDELATAAYPVADQPNSTIREGAGL